MLFFLWQSGFELTARAKLAKWLVLTEGVFKGPFLLYAATQIKLTTSNSIDMLLLKNKKNATRRAHLAPCRMKSVVKLAVFLCGCLGFSHGIFAQNSFGWSLVWSDEFNQATGSSPDTNKWAYDLGAGGWGNGELEYYTSRTNNVRIENGQLVIEAKQENFSGSSYTSARLKTQGKISWTYGRIEARIKIPGTQGIWPAFWMLGTNITSAGWPTCGEIDIMENIGREPALVHGTVHGPGYSGGSGIGGPFSLPGNTNFADDFHIYAVEWTTNQIKWFVDGLQYFGVNPASLPTNTTWVFKQPQFLLLNVAVGGGWPGNPDGTTVFPQRMTVDYIRIYAPTNLAACSGNALINPGFEAGGLASWTTYGNGSGNNLLETINHVPVHDGTNVFKTYGQFSGSDNFSGVLQDIVATAGQSFTAGGWVLTPGNDVIAGADTAWVEVSFRNASSVVLSLYRSAFVNTNTAPGAWLNFAVTNQLNPGSSAVIGTVTNLVAPAGTSTVRCRAVFHQPAAAAGAVLFDDLKLAPAGTTDVPTPVSATRTGGTLNLGFATYLNLPYEVRWKAALADANWLVLTNLVGTGGAQSLTVDLQATSRFYRVMRLCN